MGGSLILADSGDVELMGAAFQALASTQGVIEGDVDRIKAEHFMATYLISVMRGDTASASVFEMPPYIAAHSLAHTYRHWRVRAHPPDPTLKYIRDELAGLYLAGDGDRQRLVVDGALEHIFEEPLCRSDFERWRNEGPLAVAFKEAMEWVRDS